MKNIRNLICICVVLAMLLCCGLAGCGSTGGSGNSTTPAKVTDLKLNFETGEFSFSDVDVDEYYVRLFIANPAEGETEMPISAEKVRDREGATTYSGTVDVSLLTPGVAYNAVVYSYINNEDGSQAYSVSDPIVGKYKATYPTPSNMGGVSCINDNGTITVTLSGNFFTGEYGNNEPSFQINLWKGSEKVDSKTLLGSEVEVVVTTTTNQCGCEETTVEGKAEAVFTVADAEASYTVTLKVISTDDSAYYDSAEGDHYTVYLPGEAPEVDNNGGNTGDNSGESGGGETGGNESEGGETGGNESEGGETGGNESEGGETGGNESEGGETGGNESEGGESEGGESEGGEPAPTEPEATEPAPEGGESEGGESEGGESEGGESEGGESEGGESEGGEG